MSTLKNAASPATEPLYEHIPGMHEETPMLTYYPAKERKGRGTVVIFPGGGYSCRAKHEGEGYALMLNAHGLDAFVCDYRVSPHIFPLPLLDARRAVRTVRARAQSLGLDPNKIAVMGSSAGGHLAALCSTYKGPLEGEVTDDIDTLSARPDLQILCYPVILSNPPSWSYKKLTGCENPDVFRRFDPSLLMDDDTPPAFLWHTAADSGVSVSNTLRYAELLAGRRIPCEVHIFPFGNHGLGCAEQMPHVAQWTTLLAHYLKESGWID